MLDWGGWSKWRLLLGHCIVLFWEWGWPYFTDSPATSAGEIAGSIEVIEGREAAISSTGCRLIASQRWEFWRLCRIYRCFWKFCWTIQICNNSHSFFRGNEWMRMKRCDDTINPTVLKWISLSISVTVLSLMHISFLIWNWRSKNRFWMCVLLVAMCPFLFNPNSLSVWMLLSVLFV